ncbi:MAG: type II toxin-antitoxin system RelE/ParE family toxin [Pseudomonadota bacterium]
MHVKWLRKALTNLEAESSFIAHENPQAASNLVKTVESSVSLLAQNPSLGRPGRVPGTRELVIEGFPYLIPYRLRGKVVQILRVFHTSRQLPQKW